MFSFCNIKYKAATDWCKRSETFESAMAFEVPAVSSVLGSFFSPEKSFSFLLQPPDVLFLAVPRLGNVVRILVHILFLAVVVNEAVLVLVFILVVVVVAWRGLFRWKSRES